MRPSWCACLLSHACSELISYSLTDPDRDIGNITPRLSRCHGRVWCVTLEAGPLRALLGHDRLLRLQPCDPCFLLVTSPPPPACLLTKFNCFCRFCSWMKAEGRNWRCVLLSSASSPFFSYSLQGMKDIAAAYAQVPPPLLLFHACSRR